MSAPTHGELVRRAAAWLRDRPGNCRIVLNDVRLNSIQEQPDAIGWRSNGDSVLVECKASKADLRVDRHKPWRRDPTIGMGRFRWMFLSEEAFRGTGRNVGYDSIGADWGVVYLPERSRAAPRIVRRPGARTRTDVNLDEERVLLVQALLRATEGWGRHMFFEEGDPSPRFTTILRKVQRENWELKRQLRDLRREPGGVDMQAADDADVVVPDAAKPEPEMF